MSVGNGNNDWEGCHEVLNDRSCTGTCGTADTTTSSKSDALSSARPSEREFFASDIICIKDGYFELEHVFHAKHQVALGYQVK